MTLSPTVMYRALAERDGRFVGQFVAAIRTTGIFCRPGCPARTPRPENVAFFATPREALRAGFRPCKRCTPLAEPGAAPAWLRPLLDAVEADTTRRWRDRDVAALGLDPKRVRRWFRREHDMTFHAYQRARRLGAALGALQSGASVTEVALESGFESESGFRAAFGKLFDQAPSAAGGPVIELARLTTPLGPMLAGVRLGRRQGPSVENPGEPEAPASSPPDLRPAAISTPPTEDALVLLEFTDRRALETQLTRVRQLFGAAPVPRSAANATRPLWRALEDQLGRYFKGKLEAFDLPLDAPGTPFQAQVWSALTRIPHGATRTYGELAADLGRPGASRPVGTANGANRIAIVIPCHRVIGANGKLTGYAGGLERKRALLNLERPPALFD